MFNFYENPEIKNSICLKKGNNNPLIKPNNKIKICKETLSVYNQSTEFEDLKKMADKEHEELRKHISYLYPYRHSRIKNRLSLIKNSLIVPLTKLSRVFDYKNIEETTVSKCYSSYFFINNITNDSKLNIMKYLLNQSNTLNISIRMSLILDDLTGIRVKLIKLAKHIIFKYKIPNEYIFSAERIITIYLSQVFKRKLDLNEFDEKLHTDEFYLAFAITSISLSLKMEEGKKISLNKYRRVFSEILSKQFTTNIYEYEKHILNEIGCDALIFTSLYECINLYFLDLKISNKEFFELTFFNYDFYSYVDKIIQVASDSLMITDLIHYPIYEISISLIIYVTDQIADTFTSSQFKFIREWLAFINNQAIQSYNASNEGIKYCLQAIGKYYNN